MSPFSVPLSVRIFMHTFMRSFTRPFMPTITSWLILLAVVLTFQSCQPAGRSGSEAEASGSKAEASGREKEEMVPRRREDGTLSSVSPVDSEGYVHGVKVNY